MSNDSGSSDSGNKPILGSVVFVLVLEDEPLSGIVVGLAFSSPLEFGLVPHEVSLVLDHLDESHEFN